MTDNFDKLFDVVGHAGRYQYFLFFILGISYMITGWTLTSVNFLLMTPDYRCGDSEVQNFNQNSTNLNQNLGFYSIKKDACDKNNTRTTLPDPCNSTCENYEFDKSERTWNSYAVEYELICENRSYTTLIKQAWFLGIAIGALSMSIIIDNYGRKAGILVGESTRLIANLLIARSSSLQFSAGLRVLVAAGHELAQKSAYIYVIEVVGGEKRGQFGMSFIFFYSFGYASLSAIAYVLPYWRDFMMFLGLVSLVPIATLYIIDESPRYSYVQGKYDEAEKALKKIAKKNGNNPDLVNVQEIVKLDSNTDNDNGTADKKVYTIIDLFRNGSRMIYVLTVCVISWSGVNLLYYGVTLNPAGLPFNIYVSNLCYALAEWPVAILGSYAIETKKLGRVRAMALCYSSCGICLVLGSIAQKYAGCDTSFDNYYVVISICLKMIGKFLAALCFTCAYMVCAEMFPTNVRGNAMAVCSLLSRLAGLIAPWIINLGETMPLVPGYILGAVGILCGGLILTLPETRGEPMLMSFEQADQFYKKKLFKV